MAVVPREELEFDEDDLAAVAARMTAVAERRSGWVNLLPEVEEDADIPRRGGLFAIFGARGPAVPMATWKPGEEVGAGRATFGIEHGSGPQALARLRELDLGLPAGWLKVADHPKRGLVGTTPADAPVDDVLWWLLAACHVLSTVPLSGSWLARVYG